MEPDDLDLSKPVEFGQCVHHGQRITRCCVLFEPRKRTRFLSAATDEAKKNLPAAIRRALDREKTS